MRPDFAIIYEEVADGRRWIYVDTNKATYQGVKYNKLNDFNKRKWENLLFLSHPTDRVKVIYGEPAYNITNIVNELSH